LLEIQVLRSHPRNLNQKLQRFGPAICNLKKFLRAQRHMSAILAFWTLRQKDSKLGLHIKILSQKKKKKKEKKKRLPVTVCKLLINFIG
jgi:hypothetical protein